MNKNYIAVLMDAERTELRDLVKKGTVTARERTRAHRYKVAVS